MCRLSSSKWGEACLISPICRTDWSRSRERLVRHESFSFPAGGALADVVRDWHHRLPLDEEAAHQLAVQTLSINADLLTRLLPDGRKVDLVSSKADTLSSADIVVLDPSRLLERLEQLDPESCPPHNWNVTSDSLAAWVALQIRADRMILLKSVASPQGRTLVDVMQIGWIDPYFPGIAGRVPRVDWCNLRNGHQIDPWLEHGVPLGVVSNRL